MVMAMLLLAACHSGDRQQGDHGAAAPSASVPADTAAIKAPDTARQTARQPESYLLQQDSAEVVNLRIIARRQRVIYSAEALEGEWLRGTEHEIYLADGHGRMWDDSEDVTREEAQHFEWSLDSNMLSIMCYLKLGGVVPKRYVVTYVDDETLVYRDVFGTSYMLEKAITSRQHPTKDTATAI